MYNYQEKSEKVKAMRLNSPIQYFDMVAGKYISFDSGSWIVNCKLGQIILTNKEFTRRYEPIPKNENLRFNAGS